MSPFPFDHLWHYSEKFTRDQDQRQDLVLMAWLEDERLGAKSDVRLLKHFMKLRAKEIGVRSALGCSIGGKSKRDAFNHERVSIHKRAVNDNPFCIADTLTSVTRNPFSMCVVHEFENALPQLEARVAEQIISGYTDKEGAAAVGVPFSRYRELKYAVREKAMEYLT